MDGIDKPRRPKQPSRLSQTLALAGTLLGGDMTPAEAKDLPNFSADSHTVGIAAATQEGVKGQLQKFLRENPTVVTENNPTKLKQLFALMDNAHNQMIEGTVFESIDPTYGSYTMQYPDGDIMRGVVVQYNDWIQDGVNSWKPSKKYALVVPREMSLRHTPPHGGEWIRYHDPATNSELEIAVAPMELEDAKDHNPVHIDTRPTESGDIAVLAADKKVQHSTVIGPGYGPYQHLIVVPDSSRSNTSVGGAFLQPRDGGGIGLRAIQITPPTDVRIGEQTFRVARVANTEAINMILDTMRTQKPKDEGVPSPF